MDRQHREDLAAVVVDADHGQTLPGPLDTEKTADVVQEGEIAGEDHDGHRIIDLSYETEGGRRDAVDACGAAIAGEAEAGSGGHEGVEIAGRHRIRRHDDPPLGQAGTELTHDASAAPPAVDQVLVDDGGGHGVERLPAIEPLAATTSLSRTAHLHPPVGVDGVVFGSGERGVVPAMLTVDEHNVPGLHRVEPLVDRRRRGGTAELHHNIGTELLPDRVLEQVFGRGDDDVVVQPHTAHRFPDDGPGQCPGEFSDIFGKAVPRRDAGDGVGADQDHAALVRTEFAEAIGGGGADERQLLVGCGVLANRHAIDRFEGLAKRPVEVDRASACAHGRLVGPGSGQAGSRLRPIGRNGQIDGPANIGGVHADLVDRLSGTPTAKLRRPIGGAHDHRDAGVVGLDDGGQIVRRSGAGGADQHRWTARRLGLAEGEEARRAFVELDVGAQRRVGVKRERQWR